MQLHFALVLAWVLVVTANSLTSKNSSMPGHRHIIKTVNNKKRKLSTSEKNVKRRQQYAKSKAAAERRKAETVAFDANTEKFETEWERRCKNAKKARQYRSRQAAIKSKEL